MIGRERGANLAVSYRAKDPEQQRKIEELAGIREAYRHQRRIWMWMMGISFLSSAILFSRSSSLAPVLAMGCLAVGLFLVWNFCKCSRVIHTIDKGLSPHRLEERKAQK
jgi:hypothetical protein